MRIAVIGAGISGLGAAYGLRHGCELTVYESNPQPGGHAHTTDIDYDGSRISVDTGFIVYNVLNYPNLIALFAELGIVTSESVMSFSVSLDGGRREWAGDRNLLKVFAQPGNLLRPSFLWMLREIVRFNRVAADDLAQGLVVGKTLGEYLDMRGFSKRFRSDYLLPMGAAIWSMPAAGVQDFPAESFIAFFDNHRLLSFDQPVWRTVKGGSRHYVEALEAIFAGSLRSDCAVSRVTRKGREIIVRDHRGHEAAFDHVIFACHADQALALIYQPREDERHVLSAFSFSENQVFLHRDPALMPRRKAAWAAWNYLSGNVTGTTGPQAVSVTYCMNLLQGIPSHQPLFVSLNPPVEPRPELTFARFSYRHPQMSRETLAAQRALSSIQGKDRLWFAGAWSRHGFHEDGLSSGINVACALGGTYSWLGEAGLREAAE